MNHRRFVLLTYTYTYIIFLCRCDVSYTQPIFIGPNRHQPMYNSRGEQCHAECNKASRLNEWDPSRSWHWAKRMGSGWRAEGWILPPIITYHTKLRISVGADLSSTPPIHRPSVVFIISLLFCSSTLSALDWISLSPQMCANKKIIAVLKNTVQNERYVSGIFDNKEKSYNK